jgi:hypothetical protein
LAILEVGYSGMGYSGIGYSGIGSSGIANVIPENSNSGISIAMVILQL